MPYLKDSDDYVVQSSKDTLKKMGLSAEKISSAGFTAQELLDRYAAALKKDPGDWNEDARKRIITAAAAISPSPPIPGEALRTMAEGQVAMKTARSAAGLEAAEKRFNEASVLAPWWSDVYFNLGIAKERLRKPDEAISCFKLYLAAAPNSPDAAEVHSKIEGLTYKKRRMEEAGRLVNRCSELMEAGNYSAALLKAKEALRADPGCAEARRLAEQCGDHGPK